MGGEIYKPSLNVVSALIKWASSEVPHSNFLNFEYLKFITLRYWEAVIMFFCTIKALLFKWYFSWNTQFFFHFMFLFIWVNTMCIVYPSKWALEKNLSSFRLFWQHFGKRKLSETVLHFDFAILYFCWRFSSLGSQFNFRIWIYNWCEIKLLNHRWSIFPQLIVKL